MLVPFRSKAASEFFMLESHVQAIFELTAKPYAVQGIFAAPEIGAYIVQLNAALAQLQPSPTSVDGDEPSPAAPIVGLKQRAWPLLEMLSRAQKKQVDVTWGTTI